MAINVLSLFDGISCGQLALRRSKIAVANYYASEICSKSIALTKRNWPSTKFLGDVRKIRSNSKIKIHLLLGGSPCQGFSFAGKNLNFKDPRSKLFFHYVRLLRECLPTFFLFENVRMSKKSIDIINKYLCVEPIEINSNLVSAQNRKRLYWTNIPNIEQPKDRNIKLKDILETDNLKLQNYKVPYTKSRVAMWEGKCKNITYEDKSSCVTTKQDRWSNAGLIAFENFCRFLTTIELERLQTLPDNYTRMFGLSDLDRQKLIGNAWTVDIISHILNHTKK